MNLLYDLIPTQKENGHSKFHGGGEYVKSVFVSLAKKSNKLNIYGLCKKDFIMDEEIKEICINNDINIIEINNKDEIPKILEKYNIDRLYLGLPEQDKYGTLDLTGVELYITIHGLRDIEQPYDKYEKMYICKPKDLIKYLYKKLFTKMYIEKMKDRFNDLLKQNPKRIFVPSLHTKYSLMNFFPDIKEDTIKVIYSPKKIVLDNINNKSNLNINGIDFKKEEYFLLISADRWIKNNYRLIKSIDSLYSDNKNINKKVIVVGDLAKRYHIKNNEKFVFIDYVSTSELEMLYKNAFAFIYPTLNEGFGYPPLEAMKYGTSVIASAINSITEICGDAIIYFNPYSEDEMKARVLQVLHENTKDKKDILIKKAICVERKQEFMLEQLINELIC